jgi:hypothetical protein
MRTISWVWVPSFVLLAASPASAGAIILSDIRTITGSVHEFVMSDTGGEARFDDTFNFTASASEFTAAYAHRSSFDAPDSSVVSLKKSCTSVAEWVLCAHAEKTSPQADVAD